MSKKSTKLTLLQLQDLLQALSSFRDQRRSEPEAIDFMQKVVQIWMAAQAAFKDPIEDARATLRAEYPTAFRALKEGEEAHDPQAFQVRSDQLMTQEVKVTLPCRISFQEVKDTGLEVSTGMLYGLQPILED